MRAIIAILFLGCVSNYNAPPAKSTPPTPAPQAGIEFASPDSTFDYWPSYTTNDQIIVHTNYMLLYSEENEQAVWVAYELSRAEVQGIVERGDDFRPDPLVATGSAELSDYKGSGYDRGHLAPAGDMKFSEAAMSESFFMSNMSPQLPGFNRGIWRILEEKVRDWAVENGSLYVVTGGVLSSRLGTIGSNEVSIPGYYYKVLLDYSEPGIKAIAFILPNAASSAPLETFAVSIDSVEKVTEVDFYPALPDALERSLEQAVNLSGWFE